MNGNFDGTWGCGKLGDCICTLKKNRRALGFAHHENGAHQSLLLGWVCLAHLAEHLKDDELEDIANLAHRVIVLHQCLKEI